MLRPSAKTLLPVLFIFSMTACEPEPLEIAQKESSRGVEMQLQKDREDVNATAKSFAPGDHLDSRNLQDMISTAVNPSECGPTKFSEVGGRYFEKLMANPETLNHLDHYRFLNRQASRLQIGSEYFGENGRYTRLVQKLKRDLERFWDLDRRIEILGQHNSTLRDRENLADIYWYSIEDMEFREEAYFLADQILQLNKQFPELINSPCISSDGFAAHDNKIVIGDGLIQLFAETGMPYEIVWTGILVHEWAHQVQFQYLKSWYPTGSIPDPIERTRLLELEADFFSGYYMTHKRGATYNWKRAEDFFELFYQSGDCSFEFEQHHGTPLQRKRASYEGYLLAEAAGKKGNILTARQLHDYFRETVLPHILQQSEYF